MEFSQQSCHQGPFDNRSDLKPIDSKEPDPHAAFAKIVFEVYYPRISYEHSLSDFLFPHTPLVLSVTRSRVSLDCQWQRRSARGLALLMAMQRSGSHGV